MLFRHDKNGCVMKKYIWMFFVFGLMCHLSFAEDPIKEKGEGNMPQLEKATFAGGCFWCMQPPYSKIKGVKSVVVGYTGGHTENPTYDEVCSGTTGHAEAVEITFDPKDVTFEQLLKVFWHNVDPSTINQQFADYGTQYRTAIFYHSDEQKRIAEKSKKELEASKKFDRVATEITPASAFYSAEEYHQEYYKKNPLRYKMYHEGSGRGDFIKKKWGIAE